jgi:tetratricopeptide (TPR) repeat protein
LIYNPETFAANKTDTLWLNRATKMLQKERRNEEGDYEDCTGNPIFFDISDALYKLKPAAPSARAMFVMAYRNNEYNKSAQYIKEAISYEIDPLKRSADYVKLASIYIKLGSLSAAKNAGEKAAALDRSNGDAYIVIATSYALAYGTCGNNVFEKKAVYWAAINKLNKAKSIDPSLETKANNLISAYKKQLPDKNLSFQLGHIAGEEYTIACFINETITVEF